MASPAPVLLIVDYNLSRVGDVLHLQHYARKRWQAQTWLFRATPQPLDSSISDRVFAADPLAPDFVELALEALGADAAAITAGLVFSDNAVASGAALLERLGLKVDDSRQAIGAFDKLAYRQQEALARGRLEAAQVMLPAFTRIQTLEDVKGFAAAQPQGFVIKPACEGNNRGVVMVPPQGDCASAFAEVADYLEQGVLAEAFIPFTREFSYDGLANLWFITEKVSASGRYPVEVAQVLPARISASERTAIHTTGVEVNRLVGQRTGPFHNEIKLNDAGTQTAVVEPNRRPGGMKIWTLAQAVYGVDLYAAWVDSVFSDDTPRALGPARCAAATVMLGVPNDQVIAPAALGDATTLIHATLAQVAGAGGLRDGELELLEGAWLSPTQRPVRAIPRDNGDFVAQACIALHSRDVDIREVISALRDTWLQVLSDAQAPRPLRVAS